MESTVTIFIILWGLLDWLYGLFLYSRWPRRPLKWANFSLTQQLSVNTHWSQCVTKWCSILFKWDMSIFLLLALYLTPSCTVQFLYLLLLCVLLDVCVRCTKTMEFYCQPLWSAAERSGWGGKNDKIGKWQALEILQETEETMHSNRRQLN